jgi:hypothetical protein
MPHLLDDIRSQHRLVKPWFVPASKKSIWANHAKILTRMLDDHALMVLLIDNVAEYYFTGTDKEYWRLDRDFGSLVPPFPMFWAEHRMPDHIRSQECGDSDLRELLPLGGRVGVLVNVLDPQNVKGEDIPAHTRWILWSELFIDYGRGSIEGPNGSIFLALDVAGALIEVPWMQSYAPPEHTEIMKTFISWLHPMLLAVSFLHSGEMEVKVEQWN